MIKFNVRAILLDVEGTTSSISFVYEQMFPYARKKLREFIEAEFESEETQQTVGLMAIDAGFSTPEAWFAANSSRSAKDIVIEFAEQLMDADSKATGLKSLQGLLWKSGFESGELQSHVYEDVPLALNRWRDQGLKLAIYSSGSVTAQKLFFGHSMAGDLNSCFDANFDTTIGPKRSKQSYEAILAKMKWQACDVLFLSDVAEELSASHAAGLQVAAVVRPGNAPLPHWYFGPAIKSFAELSIAK